MNRVGQVVGIFSVGTLLAAGVIVFAMIIWPMISQAGPLTRCDFPEEVMLTREATAEPGLQGVNTSVEITPNGAFLELRWANGLEQLFRGVQTVQGAWVSGPVSELEGSIVLTFTPGGTASFVNHTSLREAQVLVGTCTGGR